jgi:hypothetical protein
MGGDTVIMAIADKQSGEYDEVISSMPRVNVVKDNVLKIENNKNNNLHVFIISLERDSWPISGYDDRSSKSMQKLFDMMVQNNSLTKESGSYTNSNGVKITLVPLSKVQGKHGGMWNKENVNKYTRPVMEILKTNGSIVPHVINNKK